MGRNRDPEPPTNPPEPDFHFEEHDWGEEPDMQEIDGVGVKEDESVEFTPFTVIHEEYECRRNHCDGELQRRVLFAVEDVTEEKLTESQIIEMDENAKIFDVDSIRTVHPETGESVIVDHRDVIVTRNTHGACNGEPPR